MPRTLHPDSEITQAEADELDDLLAAFLVADAAMDAQEAVLNDLVAGARALVVGIDEWEAVDLFGNGERKHADDCVRPSGRELDAFRLRTGGPAHTRTRQAHRPGVRPSARRSASAVVSVVQMDTAEAAVVARRDAYNARDQAATDLIIKMWGLQWRRGTDPGTKLGRGTAVDIWGDGRIVSEAELTIPTGLVRTRNLRVG